MDKDIGVMKDHPFPWHALKCDCGLANCDLSDIVDANNGMIEEGLDSGHAQYIVRRMNHADRLAEALRKSLQHVYANNDYTSRDYDSYYAAVDESKTVLAEYDAAKGTK